MSQTVVCLCCTNILIHCLDWFDSTFQFYDFILYLFSYNPIHTTHTDALVTHQYYYRSIFNSWQSGSGDLHAAPFPPIGFATAARSRDPIKRMEAPYHVTFVCTLPSLPSDTPWRTNTSLGLIRPADHVCNEFRSISSVTWPLAPCTRKTGSEIHKVKSSGIIL
jgi:hypothetical protein